MLARERRAIHRRIAEALTEQAGVHPVDLAYHTFAAEQWQPALIHARQAGDLALAIYSPRAAVEQYDHAAEALGRLGRPYEPGLLRSRGQAHDLLGNFPAALADYEAALSAARAGGLTAREREVVALITRGQSNREIAESLFVGEATVATHVSNTLGKLDLTSRAQIAAWAVERGLAHADDRDRT